MADADMLAVRLADQAVEIGPPHAAKSYLNADAILRAARQTGADAIHPATASCPKTPPSPRASKPPG